MSFSRKVLLLFYFLYLVSTVYSTCAVGSVVLTGFSQAEEDRIVAEHNRLRKLIADGQVENQPQGKDFEIMEWDDELAALAQDIADTCISEHSDSIHSVFGKAGQNLAKSGSTNFPNDDADFVNHAILPWFKEHEKYNYYSDLPQWSTSGHYTQIVWATSKYIGCGYINYEEEIIYMGETYLMNQKYYVCNYSPAGNIVGRAPYQLV